MVVHYEPHRGNHLLLLLLLLRRPLTSSIAQSEVVAIGYVNFTITFRKFPINIESVEISFAQIFHRTEDEHSTIVLVVRHRFESLGAETPAAFALNLIMMCN